MEPRRPGQDERCPHCGAKAGISQESDGFGVCLLCGGPRVLVDAALERPQQEKALLVRARALRMQRVAWVVGAAAAAGLSMFGAAIALGAVALMDLGAFGTVGLALLVLVPSLATVFGFSRVKSISRERTESLEEARRVVASELIARQPNLEPKDLARILHTSEDAAIELFAHVQVGGFLTDGSPPVRFRVPGGPGDAATEEAEARPEEAKRMRRGD